MRLPVPNGQEVEAFKELCRKEFGVELSDVEALNYANRILHLFYVKHYGLSPWCPIEEREPRPGPLES